MKLVSFLPSATEILYELGVGDDVLAVTHECNYPVEAKSKPRVIHSSFDPQKMSSQEIDKKVVELVSSGQDIYILDEQVLKKANPDLIVAQGICEVCSPYTREIDKAVSILGGKPEVLVLDPKNLNDILQNIITVGEKVGRQDKAKDFVLKLQKRISNIKDTSRKMQIDEITQFDPDIIILMPCGFDVSRTILEYEKLSEDKQWKKIKAVNR